MEPQREPLRPQRPQQKPSTSKEIKAFKKTPEPSVTLTETVQKNYSQEVCVILGFAFVVVGLVGFVVPYLLNAHLSATHNTLFLMSGVLALWFGFKSEFTAKRLCYIFGTIYGLLGVLGFVVGVQGAAEIANPNPDRFLWRLVPEYLEFGTSDHIIHLLAGAAFICAAIFNFTIRRRKEEF